MKNAVFIITTFLAHTIAQADGFPPGGGFQLDISRKYQIYVNENDRSRGVRLTHEVFGYEVNCSKSRILVWGKHTPLNKNNPQDSVLTIINLNSRAKPSIIELNKNIFDVKFLNDNANAIIESDSVKLLNIARGVLLNPDDNYFPSAHADPENCIDFPYKSYRKYKN